MSTRVTMPQLGESVVEATVGKWLVQQGQYIDKDQPLVEMLTDKADSEVPAPVSGVVTQLLVSEEQTVAIGAALCEIDEQATAAAASTAAAPPPAAQQAAAPPSPEAASTAAGASTPLATPAARKLARDQGIDLQQATGAQGRLDKHGLTRQLGQQAPATPASAPTPVSAPVKTGAFRPPPYVARPGDQVLPFSRRRRIIADHMVYSKQVSPDVVTLAECDLHRTSQLRNLHKGALKKEGINLTFLAFACAAVARALRDTPELNARVLDEAYVLLKDINLGIAVDTPDGLVVPVIRNADALTVRGLAKAIDDIAQRARQSKLTPDDLAGKTFTVSNPGRQGNLVGGAIISQPNVGILRLGTIKKRVVVIEHEGEDLMAIHPVMHMALTYDHRIVDGVQANSFLYQIADTLERGEFNL